MLDLQTELHMLDLQTELWYEQPTFDSDIRKLSS
jgi:hypothetical protein